MAGNHRTANPACTAPVSRKLLSRKQMQITHFEWYEPDMEMKQFVSAFEQSIDSSGEKLLCKVVEGYQGCDLMHEFSADEVGIFVFFTSEYLQQFGALYRHESIPLTLEVYKNEHSYELEVNSRAICFKCLPFSCTRRTGLKCSDVCGCWPCFVLSVSLRKPCMFLAVS